MAAMSNYLENALLNHILRAIAYTGPASVYIALLTTNAVPSDTGTSISNGTGTGVEVSGGNYARQQVPSNTSNWVSPSLGVTSNNITITWSNASWTATIVGIAICDALTNGNMLFYGPLTSSKTVSPGDTVSYANNQLTITFT